MNKSENIIMQIYRELYNLYGPQGWWPLLNHQKFLGDKTGSVRSYHPGNYDLPIERNQVYEVIIGTILTQNTSWLQAKKALLNLNKLNVINPEKLLELDLKILKKQIKCAGFFNQKAVYLREVTKFFISLNGHIPHRKDLLAVKGVGNETADSILLYAYKKPEFVVDAYTKRIFSHLGIVNENVNYRDLKEFFESNLPREVVIYNEYHALIVEHAKRYYQKKPYGKDDPLHQMIK